MNISVTFEYHFLILAFDRSTACTVEYAPTNTNPLSD